MYAKNSRVTSKRPAVLTSRTTVIRAGSNTREKKNSGDIRAARKQRLLCMFVWMDVCMAWGANADCRIAKYTDRGLLGWSAGAIGRVGIQVGPCPGRYHIRINSDY